MFTIYPSITGSLPDIYSQSNDHPVQQVSADTGLPRNVTAITDCVSFLRESAPKVGDACHFFTSEHEKDKLIRFYRQQTGSGFFLLSATRMTSTTTR